MSARLFTLPLLLIFTLVTGCGRDDPQAVLEATVQRLQDNLEAKQTSAVLEQLHPEFRAQQQLDRSWAQRTLLLLFMRHQNVKVITLGQDSHIDPTYTHKAFTDSRIALTGAEGLIPESAGHYQVKLEWWRDDDEWKLARLSWE